MAISMLYNPFPLRLFEADGDFASGAKAFFYLARTTTPLSVYTDSPLAVPHPWPVVADAYGLLPPVYLSTGTEFKVRIEDAGGSLLYAADGIANDAGVEGSLPLDAYTKAQSDASFVNVIGDVMTGNLSIDKPAPGLVLNKPAAGTYNSLLGQLAGKARWLISLGDGTAESGANAGSNFGIHAYTDAGVFLSSPLTIDRATGVVTVYNLSVPTLTVTGELKSNAGIVRLSADNSAYLYWTGAVYQLGGAGNIWHTGNFNPASYAPIGGVGGNWVVGGTIIGTDGNIYMPWAVDWLSNVLAAKAPIGGVGGNFVIGSSTHYTDGNIYMPWAVDTLANVLGGKAPTANPTFTGMTTVANLDVNGVSVRMPGLLTTTQAANAHIANTENNRFYRFNSSLATKTGLEPIAAEYSDKILDLKPIFYRSLNEADPSTWSWFGFSAENCAEVDFRFATYGHNEAGELVPEAYNLNCIVAALVELVQRQEARIRALEGAGQ